jgi:hypothetical protein
VKRKTRSSASALKTSVTFMPAYSSSRFGPYEQLSASQNMNNQRLDSESLTTVCIGTFPISLRSKYRSMYPSIFSPVTSSSPSNGTASPLIVSSITNAGNFSETRFKALAKKPYFVASIVAKSSFPLYFSATGLRRERREACSEMEEVKMCKRGRPDFA